MRELRLRAEKVEPPGTAIQIVKKKTVCEVQILTQSIYRIAMNRTLFTASVKTKIRLPEGSGSLNYLKKWGDAYEGKMMDEVERCFIYDPEGECRGASGRKLRQVCVYCPMMQKYYTNKKRKEEKDNVEKTE